MRTWQAITAVSMMTLAVSAAAQTVVPVGHFRSVELQNGGNVVVRHGPVQRVTILAGDLRYTQIRVDDRQRLVIDRSGQECPRGYQVHVEVVTPEVGALAVSNGGTLQTAGEFPPQASLDAGVEQGGTLDLRAISADAVDATVYSGGRILAAPRHTLSTTITSGGNVTYWGDPQVSKHVRDGGAVQRGRSADARRPLAELNGIQEAIPSLPAVPPVPHH